MKNRKRELELMREQNPNMDHDLHDSMLIGSERYEDWREQVDPSDLNEDLFQALSQLQG
jgi:hypothetical protein